MGFQVERKKLNEVKWTVAGFVDGNGTSTELNHYTFSDENLVFGKYPARAGQVFYRLKQVDFDGSFTYSKTIEVDVNTMPDDFVLSQNYPNPFNPSTTIKYSVPKIINNQSSIINLKVYDVLGNEVATLVNEEKSPGNYEVEWNASGFASGVYFYRLKAGDFNSVKKLVLMK